MKARKVHLTAQIKQSTKHALMDQLALAAEEICVQRVMRKHYAENWRSELKGAHQLRQRIKYLEARRWWHRFAWWRK